MRVRPRNANDERQMMPLSKLQFSSERSLWWIDFNLTLASSHTDENFFFFSSLLSLFLFYLFECFSKRAIDFRSRKLLKSNGFCLCFKKSDWNRSDNGHWIHIKSEMVWTFLRQILQIIKFDGRDVMRKINFFHHLPVYLTDFFFYFISFRVCAMPGSFVFLFRSSLICFYKTFHFDRRQRRSTHYCARWCIAMFMVQVPSHGNTWD